MSRGTRPDVAGVGAVLAAALASACCILPAILGAIGLSGAVLSAFFEPLRPWFLALAAILLSAGFYLAMRRPAEGEACTSSGWLAGATRPTLFASALATFALAMAPGLMGLAADGPETLASEVASEVVVLQVDGMTCESCAPAVRSHLLDVPGVIDAAVSYERARAEVRVRAERPPDPERLVEAVAESGYAARVVSE